MRAFLTDFENILPPYSASQEEGLLWLLQAHSVGKDSASLQHLERKFQKFCCKPPHIQERRSYIEDFTHQDWDQMELYPIHQHPQGQDLGKRSAYFKKVTDHIFDKFYTSKRVAPHELIHVTCTGYNCPSSAQCLVSKKGWEKKTSVTHAYHMGCMGAIKAIRIAEGLIKRPIKYKTDIVHTELCSLHLNPSLNTAEQLIGESLFADGFIKYTMQNTPPQKKSYFEVNHSKDEIIFGTESLMGYECKSWGFQMTLNKEIPSFLAKSIKGFLKRLDKKYDQEDRYYAIHPGGPKIIDLIAQELQLQPYQIETTKKVFSKRGNMSSATLPHIWEKMLETPQIKDNSKIISIAFGPGLTICGLILTKKCGKEKPFKEEL